MPTIKENLIAAIAAAEAFPERSVDLENFRLDHSCGTLYCLIGLLTTESYFAVQGLALQRLPSGTYRLTLNGAPAHNALDTLFGVRAFRRLFDSRGDGDWDAELHTEDDPLTDKELALARLHRQLEQYA